MRNEKKDKSKVVAIFCSDLHLQSKPPVLRSKEPDWFAAIKRPLFKIQLLKNKYNCPVFCCGDIFDNWDSSPELINWACENLPEMYAIPGQHDLPNHDFSQIKKSAFYTLMEAGIVNTFDTEVAWKQNEFESSAVLYKNEDLVVIGASYGAKLPAQKNLTRIQIGVMHKYTCKRGHDFSKAKQTDYVDSPDYCQKNSLKDYNIIFFGDNHDTFMHTLPSGQTIVNCGTIIRRHKNELKHKPSVWLVYSNQTIKRHQLDTSEDVYYEPELSEVHAQNAGVDITDFVEGLERLGDSALDFSKIFKQYINTKSVHPAVKRLILQAMEK